MWGNKVGDCWRCGHEDGEHAQYRPRGGFYVVSDTLENAQNLARYYRLHPPAYARTQDDIVETARATGLKAFYVDPYDPSQDQEIEVPPRSLWSRDAIILMVWGVALALLVFYMLLIRRA